MIITFSSDKSIDICQNGSVQLVGPVVTVVTIVLSVITMTCSKTLVMYIFHFPKLTLHTNWVKYLKKGSSWTVLSTVTI